MAELKSWFEEWQEQNGTAAADEPKEAPTSERQVPQEDGYEGWLCPECGSWGPAGGTCLNFSLGAHPNGVPALARTRLFRREEIRLQVLEEVREALVSDDAVLAGAKRLFNREEPSMDQLWDVLKTIRAVSRTALAKLSEEKTDE